VDDNQGLSMKTNEARALVPFEPAKVVPIRAWKGDDDVKHYVQSAKSPTTRKGYERDFRRFERWCLSEGFGPLPASALTVARYASHRAKEGNQLKHIRRELSAITITHRQKNLDSPVSHEAVKATLAGIAREHGSAVTQAPPILVSDLRLMVEACDLNTLRGARDAAVLLTGFTMALRRSELVQLDVEHLEMKERGVVANIVRQKNDKEGVGYRKAVLLAEDTSMCATLALKRWLRVSGRTSGALFCTVTHGDHMRSTRIAGQTVNRIVQRYAALAGLEDMRFSSHSMRAGFVTQRAKDGVPLHTIQQQTGHKSLNMLMQYVRKAVELGDDNPTAGLL